jgi:tetratricopeptide (TPR) repeat protein
LATCGSSKQALGAALNNVGNNLRSAGRVTEASKFLARALDQAEAIGDRTADSIRSLNLGHTLARMGKHHEAVEQFTRAMEFSEHRRDMVLYHKALASRASSLSALEKHDTAEADIRRALKYAIEASRFDEEMARRNNLAVILAAAGKAAMAVDELTAVEKTARNLGDPRLEALAMSNRGTFLARLAQYDEALRALETACRQFQSLPDPLNVAKSQGEKSGAGRVSEASEAEAVAERLRKQYG